MSRSWLAALSLIASACGARTGIATPVAIDGGVDAPRVDALVVRDAFADDPFRDDAFVVPDAFALDAGDPCDPSDAPLAEPVCTRALFADDPVLSCPGGFVDVVARGDGALRWECGGRRAEATFSDRVYRGTRTGDRFALCIETEFDFADGCHWQSFQRIEGALDDGTLRLTYREQPVTGTSCLPACTADSVIEVR